MKSPVALLLLISCSTFAADDIKTVSVRDLVIDGPKLADQNAHVRLTGSVVKIGNGDVLFENDRTATMAKYTDMEQPMVYLLTEDASHDVRSILFDCHRNPYAACHIEVTGFVTMCEMKNVFGSARETPCLDVKGGSLPLSPPPPSAAELERQRKAKEAAEVAQKQTAEHVAKLAAERAAQQRLAVDWVYRRDKATCLQKMSAHRLPGQDDPEPLCDSGARKNANANPAADVIQYCAYMRSIHPTCDTPEAETTPQVVAETTDNRPSPVQSPESPAPAGALQRAQQQYQNYVSCTRQYFPLQGRNAYHNCYVMFPPVRVTTQN